FFRMSRQMLGYNELLLLERLNGSGVIMGAGAGHCAHDNSPIEVGIDIARVRGDKSKPPGLRRPIAASWLRFSPAPPCRIHTGTWGLSSTPTIKPGSRVEPTVPGRTPL